MNPANTEPENRLLTPPLSSVEEERASVAPADLSRRSQAKADSNCRRNGNIARLPKAVRDKINVMIQDGVPYSAIIKRLGEDGKGLCASNLTRWQDGATVLLEHGFLHSGDIDTKKQSDTARMMLSDDPAIWRPLIS